MENLLYVTLYVVSLGGTVVFVYLVYAGKLKKIRKHSPTQSKTLSMRMNSDEAFQICGSVLESFGATIKEQDILAGQITATTGLGWRSFGEVITIDIAKDESDKVEVKITSVPKMGTTELDFGKGHENVNHLAALLIASQNKKHV